MCQETRGHRRRSTRLHVVRLHCGFNRCRIGLTCRNGTLSCDSSDSKDYDGREYTEYHNHDQ